MKLPEEIIKKYEVTEYDIWISIMHPATIIINKDDHFKIEERPNVFDISNKHVSVTLFKNVELMNIVVFNQYSF